MLLKQVRLSRGWTQSQLAERCGMDQSAIAHFESNRRQPTLRNLIKLADALGCSLDQLVGRVVPTCTMKRASATLWECSNCMAYADMLAAKFCWNCGLKIASYV
jgi:transcriptional regulator with XRE-family HTH domain